MRGILALILVVVVGGLSYFLLLPEEGSDPALQPDSPEQVKSDPSSLGSESGSSSARTVAGAPPADVKPEPAKAGASPDGGDGRPGGAMHPQFADIPQSLFGPVPDKKLTFGNLDPPKEYGPLMSTLIMEDNVIGIKSRSVSHHPATYACNLLGITDATDRTHLQELWESNMKSVSQMRLAMSTLAIELHGAGLPMDELNQVPAFNKAKQEYDESHETYWKAWIDRAKDFSKEDEARRVLVRPFGSSDFWGSAFQE